MFILETGEWRRAVVEGVAGSPQYQRYTVMLLDYGVKTTVDRNRIRPFPKFLLSSPPQAASCVLAGLRSQHLLRVNTFKCFQELVLNRTLTARVVFVDEDGTHHVQLSDETEGLNINNELISRGLASPVC